MDQLDYLIISELNKNCRLTLSSIAKNIKSNRNVIKYRLDKLEENKIITKYITTLDLGKLRFMTFKIYLKTKITNSNKLTEFFQKEKQIIQVLQLEGKWNYSCVYICKEIIEIDSIITKLKTLEKNLIKDYSIEILIKSTKNNIEKLFSNNIYKINTILYNNKNEEIKLDKIDEEILKNISQDANKSIVKIANQLNLSIDIVKYRLQQLQKQKIITSFEIIFDIEKINLFHYTLLISTNKLNFDEKEFQKWTEKEKYVHYTSKMIGKHDYEINFGIKNLNELNQFINSFKEKFEDKIESYETLVNSKLIKLNFVPF